MVPVLHCALGQILVEMVDNCSNVRTSEVGLLEKLSDEYGEGEQLGVQELVASWLGDCLGCHRCSYMCGGAHTKFLDDLGYILVLAESENPLLSIPLDYASK